MFTQEQSRKALHYSIKWLEQEIKEIELAIDSTNDIVSKNLLKNRLFELRKDYYDFSDMNI
ncbi:hypothetical protein AAXB25_14910 [Paenibacillus lautus]|uniref:hypothetical protein n=1 Tax=Paenibacillus lautus TaxID=1401 RepID=UPI003D29EC55